MDNVTGKRSRVARDYARAVQRPSAGGGCCCGKPAPKGVVAKLAGYTDLEVAGLPIEAVVNSFGCGNPLAFSEVAPGDTVLDLGSGAGIDLLLAAKKVGSRGRVIGVDMTAEMIAKARENVVAAGLDNVELRQGIIEELPVADGSVDWVISNCVINLSPEKPRVFKEIARVLRPGGRMLVSDIVAEDLPAEVSGNAHLHSSCLAGAIPEAAYLQGLADAGLVELQVRDRLVYDADQIRAFIGSELPEDGGCCGIASPELGALAARVAPLLEGKIASVKVFGRKPA